MKHERNQPISQRRIGYLVISRAKTTRRHFEWLNFGKLPLKLFLGMKDLIWPWIRLIRELNYSQKDPSERGQRMLEYYQTIKDTVVDKIEGGSDYRPSEH